MLVSCQKAIEYSEKQQYNEATRWEKVKLYVHNLHCKLCDRYHSLNTLFSKKFAAHQPHFLSADEKEHLSQVIRSSQ